ncbi:hypothetical protein KM043_011749 [Ampulex compressa]|nr:hypothetical protein KM043_011749 [Ampulex compressa]
MLRISDITEKKVHINPTVFLYTIFIGPCCIALFLHAFFPIPQYDGTLASEEDIPNFVEGVRVDKDRLYKPMVTRLVIMIIDALRWDFVAGPIGKLAMPVTNSLIANSSGCLFRATVQSPTVTMPRIKAITTGSVPNFIELVLNFGSKPLSSDNILHQVKRENNIIFYGDDTWLRLFPNTFYRSEGTTSFIVTDFTEVDNNVTRHIDEELNKFDWTIMILHYLGLDHIGHVHGPFNSRIKSKLSEMDQIIARIYMEVEKWNEAKIPTLFIISGDHGMKNSGGHGGSTIEETTVPFIVMGRSCVNKNNDSTEISQLDIASTLSAILGVPIPFSNLGSLFLNKFYSLPPAQELFLLYYNAKQVLKHFEKLADYESHDAYLEYLKAIKLHVAWLKDHPSSATKKIVQSYYTALQGMRNLLMQSMIKYDTYAMATAVLFLFHILIIIGQQNFHSIKFERTVLLIILHIALWLLVNTIWGSEDGSIFHSKDISNIWLISAIVFILFINCYLLATVKYTGILSFKKDKKNWIFLLATVMHAISLSSSSFIEEEHQTWYFYWVTLLTVLLYSSFQMFVRSKRCKDGQLCIALLLLLIGHRILRKLNSTGDKYANLPDIADWLIEQENIVWMTLLLITGLALLVWIGIMHEDSKYTLQFLGLYMAIATCIYLYHMSNNTVAKIPLYPPSRGIFEVQMFWCLLLTFLIIPLSKITLTRTFDKKAFLKNILYFILQMWIIITTLLQRPYNVILLPLQLIYNSVICKILINNDMMEIIPFVYSWSGNVFYFYQGNSNNLANIDVAAGYIGLQSYVPIISGIFIMLNTFTAPVLAYLTLLYQATVVRPQQNYQAVIIYLYGQYFHLSYYTKLLIPQ